MKAMLGASVLALFLTTQGLAENWTYTLHQTNLDEAGLQRFCIDWDSPGQFRFGTMQRNLRNQANINFLYSGEFAQIKSCQVFIPPHCTADDEAEGHIQLGEKGYGLVARFRRQEGTTRVELETSWPTLLPRSEDYVWADPNQQFLCVTELYRPEERKVMAELPLFDTLFPKDSSLRTPVLFLSASSSS